jgi:hypothetical protein
VPRYTIRFLSGPREVASVVGTTNVSILTLTPVELQAMLLVEPLLERLTGFRVHLLEVPERRSPTRRQKKNA